MKRCLLTLVLSVLFVTAPSARETCFATDVRTNEVVVAIQSFAGVCSTSGNALYTVQFIDVVPSNSASEKIVCAGWPIPAGYTAKPLVNAPGCAGGRGGAYNWLNAQPLVYNRNPIGGGKTIQLAVNQQYYGSAAMTDPDGDMLAYSTSYAGGKGAFVLNAQTGNFDYTPPFDFEGTVDVNVVGDDGKGGNAYYLLTFVVGNGQGENHPPVLVDPQYTVTTGTRTPFRLYPTDPDGDFVTVQIDPSRPIAHGYLEVINASDKLFAYTSHAGYVGPDKMYVIATDIHGASSTNEVTFNVIGTDPDGDGMPTAYENQWGLNPWDASDGPKDLDNDGLSNVGEYQSGTKPNVGDTDGDGMPDGYEKYRPPLNPLLSSDAATDADSDGYSNLDEYRAGTDPLNKQIYPGHNPVAWLIPVWGLILN